MLFSSCSCARHTGSSSRLNVTDAERRRRADPTGLSSVRRRYEADMVARFRLIRKLIVEAIVKLDVLGLQEPGNVQATSFAANFMPRVTRDAVAAPQPGAFRFDTNARKVQGFMNWLRQAQREGILEISSGVPNSMAANASWQNTYIDSAYQKGIRDAYKRAGKPMGPFNAPVHADAAGLIYTRAYEDLEGITQVMSTQISRSLAQSMVEGRSAMDTARRLADRVDKVGITRARTIARTEMTRAYGEATLNSYKEMGVHGVEVEAEFSTAGDDSVCPECEELEGKIYSLEEASGLIPVHPNCRCAYIPVVKEEE